MFHRWEDYCNTSHEQSSVSILGLRVVSRAQNINCLLVYSQESVSSSSRRIDLTDSVTLVGQFDATAVNSTIDVTRRLVSFIFLLRISLEICRDSSVNAVPCLRYSRSTALTDWLFSHPVDCHFSFIEIPRNSFLLMTLVFSRWSI